MKKAIRIIIPLLLVLAIIVCTGWYLFIYDREFTRDVLLHGARYFENKGNRNISTWFYNTAYLQAGNNDAVAIELAEQYRESGNYTKAEYTLSKAIADGGGIDLYVALSKTFVEQDKLLDAVNMLNNVTNKDVKAQLEKIRPAAPTSTPDPVNAGSYYTQYITVTVSSSTGTLYVSNDGEYPSVKEDLYKNGITLKSGENKLYAVAVDDNGLVSPASIFGFTVGGVVEKVAFVDRTIEASIREILKVSADKVLHTNDLWTIKEFAVPEGAEKFDDLRHLAFLEKLTINNRVSGQLSHISHLANLKELEVTGTAVSAEELAIIGKLPNLQKLNLSGCSLSTTAGLEVAANLTHLDLSNNAIRNIAPLAGLKKIQQLKLNQNALNDLTSLSALTTLTVLDVSNNNLTSLSPITSIVGLEQLSAGYNTVTDLNNFQLLTALKELNVSNNGIGDITPLKSCTELTKLNISGNALTDISALSGLNKLTEINFSNNKVKAIPKWDVTCELVTIDGSYNQLNTLEPLKGLKKLNNVFMDYNKEISSVKALADCPVLIQVNVYGTKVKNVSALTAQDIVVNYDPT